MEIWGKTMVTKKYNKKAREFGVFALTVGTSSAVVAGLGAAGGSSVVTSNLQSGLGTASKFAGIGVTAYGAKMALDATKGLNKKRKSKFKY